MGGDACHHCGEFRPTEYLPIPNELSPSPLSSPPFTPGSFCPGSLLTAVHPLKSATQPFYKPREDPSLLQNYKETLTTIGKMTEFDANTNVLTIIAHDGSLLDVPSCCKRLEGERLETGGNVAIPGRFPLLNRCV
jgi:hypothetical protein